MKVTILTATLKLVMCNKGRQKFPVMDGDKQIPSMCNAFKFCHVVFFVLRPLRYINTYKLLCTVISQDLITIGALSRQY